MEFRLPVELPLWGNLAVAALVAFLLGFVVRDLIQVYKKDRDK